MPAKVQKTKSKKPAHQNDARASPKNKKTKKQKNLNHYNNTPQAVTAASAEFNVLLGRITVSSFAKSG